MWSQNQVKVTSANFQKVKFLTPMHRKSILDIMGSQNKVKVNKGISIGISALEVNGVTVTSVSDIANVFNNYPHIFALAKNVGM